MTNEIPLHMDHLSKRFGTTDVLRDLSLKADRGQTIGLLGLNGAGKSTLLETALGFNLPDSGRVLLFGHDCANRLETPLKHRIGFVPQRDELIDTMNGRLYLELIGAFYPRWNAALVLALANEWTVPLEQRISKLSVGQRQKLSIISALGHEPELLILDEPVASLDPLARRQFLKTLIAISANHDRTIVFSTHIVSDLERIASHVWLLRDGQLLVDSALDELKEQYVRVHLPSTVALPEIPLPGLLGQRVEAHGHVLVFRQWSDAIHGSLERQSGVSITPEPLGLEDIFLELHA